MRAVPSWEEDVQYALLPGTAAIEFVHFNQISKTMKQTKDAALLVKYGETQPFIIPLFEESRTLYNIISSNKNKRTVGY
ncbi:MAG: hypothetical protein IPL42_14450 [Saprospiraceae bacterium]|nr:hypothetical protein [Saprospiraceae bacterium]